MSIHLVCKSIVFLYGSNGNTCHRLRPTECPNIEQRILFWVNSVSISLCTMYCVLCTVCTGGVLPRGQLMRDCDKHHLFPASVTDQYIHHRQPRTSLPSGFLSTPHPSPSTPLHTPALSTPYTGHTAAENTQNIGINISPLASIQHPKWQWHHLY